LVFDAPPRREPGSSAGPDAAHAPTSRPLAGFTSLEALEYRGLRTSVIPLDTPVAAAAHGTIAAGQELRYAVLPEWCEAAGSALDGFAADAVAVDLVFDDGGRLSDLAPLDQYGILLDPVAQHAGRVMHPDQWNLVRVDLNAAVGRHVVGAELRFARVLADHIDAAVTGWLDALGIVSVPLEPVRPVDWARTRQGSMSGPALSRGNTVPAVAVPNGFVTGVPLTRAHEHNWLYSWHRDNRDDNRPALQGFGTSHAPSPWIGERGAFHVMPSTAASTPDGDVRGRALGFSHDAEVGRPDYYRVELDGGIVAELTAADHTVLVRFRFPVGSSTGVVIFDQVEGTGVLRLPSRDRGESAVRAWTDDAAGTRVDRELPPRAFLHAVLDRPIVDSGMLPVAGKEPRVRGTDRSSARGWVRVALDEDRTVTVRMATSFIGTAQATRNLRDDRADESFESVRERAAQAWDDWIGRIEIEDASAEQRSQMATALYRVGLFPNRAHENLGTSSAPDPHYASVFGSSQDRGTADETGASVIRGELTVNHGFWDVYRTAWPLYCLLDPARASRLLDGFAEHYRAGGWTSRWSAPGPIDSMTGTSNDVVFAHAVGAGVPIRLTPDDSSGRVLDLWAAYESALRNATVPPPTPLTGRKGIHTSIFRGWVDTSIHESVGWTLDGSINDLAVAHLAGALLDRVGPEHPRRDELEASVAYFRARAGAHRHIFDTAAGFYRGRDAEGRFAQIEDFDPESWGGDYTETNAWGTAFSAPHDGAGLVALFGGRERFERQLLDFYATPETADERFRGGYPHVIHEMIEARNLRLGMLGLSNQPAHHIPFMALFAGRPDLAQDVARTAVERMFTGGEVGQGWPGDEDNGEMSAWWVFAALGLYPLVAGTAGYVLVSPLFRRARVRLGESAELVVEAPAADREHRFIRSVRIDGQEWTSTFVPHERIADGAVITIDLATEPQGWGSDPAAEPPSLTEPGRSPVALRDLTAHSSVVVSSGEDTRLLVDDDSGSGSVLLRRGETVLVEEGRPGPCEFLTLTPVHAGVYRWSLEREADLGWETVGTWTEEFRWDMQTRPFIVSSPASSRWRLAIHDDLPLAQLELLRRG